ncbi:YheC/YheD family protein [Bacillus sp. NPDC077027]|uniref:YheC/YheD family endospore coat-associated protein n=1 Tax=Bacillus sp. NPDC077027 TaxID=3390548 RepID=UPI003D084536
MIKRRYSIGIHQKSEQTIHLPVGFKKQIAEVCYVALGSRTAKCNTFLDDQLRHSILLSKDLYLQLLIPHQTKVDVFIHDETLYFGPLIGIFSAGFHASTDPLGKRTDFFNNLLAECQKHFGFTYIFGSHSIDWELGVVEGLFLQDQQWTYKEVPLPTVVYDRLPSRKTEQSARVQETKRRLMFDYDIPWFNPDFFNKWNIHEQLLTDERTLPFLPHSFQLHYLDALSKIGALLHLHDVIYLKPMNGSFGNGIYQLKKEDVGFSLESATESRSAMCSHYQSIEEFFTDFQRNNNIHEYIAQQGIELIQLNHRSLDFRVHTNKNTKGKWTITAVAAKVSGDNCITTHVLSGGIVKTLAEVYTDPQKRLEIYHNLASTALLLSQVIDEKASGLIGEIGFDLGIDRTGAIWMFEANSRPGRGIFEHVSLKNAKWLSTKRTVEYAAFLSKEAILTLDNLNLK